MSAIQLGIGYTVSNLLYVQIDILLVRGTSFCYELENVVFCWLMNERSGKLFFSHAFEHCMEFDSMIIIIIKYN